MLVSKMTTRRHWGAWICYSSSEIEFQSALEEQLFKSKIDEKNVLIRTGLGCAAYFRFRWKRGKRLEPKKIKRSRHTHVSVKRFA
jgi:hypothetical protein